MSLKPTSWISNMNAGLGRSTSSDGNWHKTGSLNRAAQQFHDNYARQPSKAEMADAKELHQLYMDRLQRILSSRGICSRLEYTGSSYEGVKVRRSATDYDFEFDIMVILQSGSTVFQTVYEETFPPGYVSLQAQSDWLASWRRTLITKSLDDNNLLSAEKLADGFMGELQKCLDLCQKQEGPGALRHISDRIKLRRHGPAVQMDVMHPSPSEMKGPNFITIICSLFLLDLDFLIKVCLLIILALVAFCISLIIPESAHPTKFYSVDMVPTIVIKGRYGEEEYYVPKPIQDTIRNRWRQSFSMKEKNLLRCDDVNSCRKLVLRILKVIRNREPGLAQLTSYHLKTALFRVMLRLDSSLQWRNEHLGERLMDVLSQLEQELESGSMPHYFLPRVNLLRGIGEVCIENMKYRLSHLVTSETAMMRLLQS